LGGPALALRKRPLMTEIDDKAEYLTLAEKLVRVADGIFREAKVSEDEGHSSNPKMIGLMLLRRTVNNFAGARLLLENDFIVEARTLLRCCYENFFWLAGLSVKGAAFVNEMVSDYKATKLKRGRELLEWAEEQTEPLAFEEKLSEFMADATGEKDRPSKISHFDAAKAGGIVEAYIIYRVLSTDAAHPSITSLDRHLREEGEDELTLLAVASVTPEEVIETLEFCCSVLLGVCVAINSMLGGTEAGKPLPDLFDDYKRISRAACVERRGRR
jgi:hypothetical protein